ncbi:MAG: TonB-dependent receptor [Sphingomonadaceae bacterium]
MTAAGLVGATPAFAQDADEGVGIGDIVVTAQRREETLQDAAIAIDAVTGNDLAEQGVTTADDIGKIVPSIAIVNGGGTGTSVFLRGVGNVTNNNYYDAAISSSYDGVVLGRASGAFTSAFYDLERVEVLKGPQGILYGRNATGGAVNIIPKKPELDRLGAGVNLSFGNYSAFGAEGYINAPLGQDAALRFSATRQSRDGFNRDGSDDLDRWAMRAQLLFEPTDRLSIRISGDYTAIGGIGAGSHYLGHFQGPNFIASGLDKNEGMYTDAANAYRQTVLGAPGFGFLNPMNRQQSTDWKGWGVHAEVKLDTGIGEVTFIPGYREGENTNYFFGPAFNTALFDETNDQFSAELRLAGSAGMIDYVVGGFYFDENVSGNNEFNQEFVLPMQDYVGGTKSVAAFGQLTANLSERLRLVGGLRYTHDKKFIDGQITNFITFCGPNAPPPVTPPASFGIGCQIPGNLPHYPNLTDPQAALNWLIAGGWISPSSTLTQLPPFYSVTSGVARILRSVNAPSDSGTFSKVTWKAGVEFDATPDNLLYATVETGYRAGGFQLAESYTNYDPETITAFTIGSKNRFLGNKLQLNVEAFLWKYKDQQINFFTISPDSVLVSATQNVGKSDIKGFDIDLVAKPMRNTTLSAKVQFLDTKYQGLILRTAPPRDNFNCPRSVDGTLADGVTPIFAFDCSGNSLLFSPKWTLNLGAEQVIPMSDNVDLVASVFTAWKDDQWGNFNYLDFQRIPANWTTGASLTFKDVDGGWSLGGYVNNIENNRHVSYPQASPIGFAVVRYTAPRTYGVRFTGDF